MKQDFYHPNVPCHICGFPIPEISSVVHPLFGTIDHVVPFSDGGKDAADNRLPAHRICNNVRSSSSITPDLKAYCQTLVVREFSRLSEKSIPNSKRYRELRKQLKKLHATPFG
jgi:hypothetical protein